MFLFLFSLKSPQRQFEVISELGLISAPDFCKIGEKQKFSPFICSQIYQAESQKQQKKENTQRCRIFRFF